MRRWPLKEAKARFSEVVKSAQQEGPQEISVRGEPTAVVISRAEYDRLRRPRPSFVEFLRGCPLAGVELDLERDRTAARTVRL
jgi:prevent-host-death family protein